MALPPGTRLGVYEITEPIGEGGMGQVYRASDTKLKRQVAIKILRPSLAADAHRLARFQREAEVLASLNHPNIAGIYGLEENGGITALVMELVEGEDLSRRIARGAIPIEEALAIAGQIAMALEAAREQGVIHRDLKPGNIKLRPNGAVKLLDFGLAKLAQMSDADLKASDASQAPTAVSLGVTQLGTIMGTAAYMSPEQARGRAVDKRTDIWAFGCVLYEMLSGRSAFGAATISDTLARILEREPDWRALPASTPTRVREVLRRCLDKDQQGRLPDIAAARVEIEEVRTALSRPHRLIGLPTVAGGIALAFTVLMGASWYVWKSTPSVQREPVSIVIADFQNGTSDPTFDRTLEPMLKLALDGAGFISAYDRIGVFRNLGVRPPDKLDERAALELAAKEGIGVVLSGSLDRQGNRFGVAIKVSDVLTGKVNTSFRDTASSKDEVLGVVTNLAIAVRDALGDHTSDSDRRFARETLSATSFDAAHEYAAAMDAMSNSRFEEALRGFSRVVALDSNFGLAYTGMAVAARNLDKPGEVEKYIKEAVQHLGTGRERYRTRGLSYLWLEDYRQCVAEFGELLARYPSDAMARNNLGLCLAQLRQLPKATEEMRRLVKMLPNRTLYRENLALYAAYTGDAQTAEQEARALKTPRVFGLLPLAFALALQGQLGDAAEIYRRMTPFGPSGASYAMAGLGDLALYEGRFGDAARMFTEGAAQDLSSKDRAMAANKFAALAYTQVLRRQNGAAVDAAEKALINSKAAGIRFLAARTFVDAGEVARAKTLSASLAAELVAEPQAYAAIIDGLAALRTGDARQAIQILAAANGRADTWIGHFDLGRAYLQAGAFSEAKSEFERCLKRRGEALALFLDEAPTYGYFPSVYYYLGRAQEGLKSEGSDDSYRSYLEIRGTSTEDPRLPEVRRRLATK